MMDINYELYKVFYHVATTLNFSEAPSSCLFHSLLSASRSKHSNENWIKRFLSEAQRKSSSHRKERFSCATLNRP